MIGHRDGVRVEVYTYGQLLKRLMDQQPDRELEDAMEWADYNIVGAWEGPDTPIYVSLDENDEIVVMNDWSSYSIEFDREAVMRQFKLEETLYD
jgi:hypothetical protein